MAEIIEVTIRNHLSDILDVPVELEKPEPAPDEYILFQKTGSGRSNYLGSSTFAFQSYSTSKYKAAVLNEKVKDAVDSLINLNEISRVQLNSDYDFTDTTTKQYRYQAVYDINHY